MAAIASLLSPLPTTTGLYVSTSALKATNFSITKLGFAPQSRQFNLVSDPESARKMRRFAIAEETTTNSPSDPLSEAARRLYIGNIPRTVNNDQLLSIVNEHGTVEKAEVMFDKYSGRSRRFGFVTMKTIEDANAAAEKLNGTKIEGREIKVNITEKPLQSVDSSPLQAEDSQYVDSPYKVYVGNLAKSVNSQVLKEHFLESGNALSAKVSRIPGTSKSSGYGFVAFSNEEDVEAAISTFNNSMLQGQQIRVNKA